MVRGGASVSEITERHQRNIAEAIHKVTQGGKSTFARDIAAKLNAEHCRNLTDRELWRCLQGTGMPDLCYDAARYMRNARLLRISIEDDGIWWRLRDDVLEVLS
jgi:hypothetical protein